MRLRVETFVQRRLRRIPPPANLDVRPLEGKAPWLRVRVGDVRIVCRRLTNAELAARGVRAPGGYLIVRVVHRRELERAIGEL